ncbi:hypothetical protein NKG05_22365 [Oerskovia sp. M15]
MPGAWPATPTPCSPTSACTASRPGCASARCPWQSSRSWRSSRPSPTTHASSRWTSRRRRSPTRRSSSSTPWSCSCEPAASRSSTSPTASRRSSTSATPSRSSRTATSS